MARDSLTARALNEWGLSDAARAALEVARRTPLSWAVQELVAPDGRLLIVLGEAHVKLAAASELGRAIVSEFALRGVETFPVRRVAVGYPLWLLIHVPRVVLRALSFGLIKGSTITDAKALAHGHTVGLEDDSAIPLALHLGATYLAALFVVFWSNLALAIVGKPVPSLTWMALAFEVHMFALIPAWILRRRAWSWILHPAIAILTVRDAMMAEGTVAMLRAHPGPRAAVVVMGRAHVAGYTQVLVEEHGFAQR